MLQTGAAFFDLGCLLLGIYFIFTGCHLWKTLLRDYALMPSPHHEEGSQDYFVIDCKKEVCLAICTFLNTVYTIYAGTST